MPRSMTAFAETTIHLESISYQIEIQSLNKRFSDFSLNLPKEISSLEIEIRTLLPKFIKRGTVTVRIIKRDKESGTPNYLNLSSLKKIKEKLSKVKEELNLEGPISLELLIQLSKESTDLEEEKKEEVKKALLEGTQKVLKSLIEMKEKEGQALVTDLKTHIAKLRDLQSKIQPLSAEFPKRYQERLKQKLAETKQLPEIDQARLHQEVAIISDKVDISEELARLTSHLTQFEELLDSSEISIGRTLEFLSQEMVREVNTMAAKSQETDLSKLVVAAKSELEKIREQLMNIE